ncbi:zinc finger protein 367-like [Liolophura sinensis]|uniref:zinc finger protein 367-like n=1 Tax=Liolophura sinensis TaxID=3198878 RepID=UPI003158B9F8
MLPWNWSEPRGRGRRVVSPQSSCSTPDSSGSEAEGSSPPLIGRHRRGRPRADHLLSLQVQGSSSTNTIQCYICNRVFPREKSLQAHMRTHTGERPYRCDFPNCTKAFCQSGQLKTHQRLHTGEKPFVCSISGCSSRFTHANRRCTLHPLAPLHRVKTPVVDLPLLSPPEQCDKVMQWLARHAAQKQETTPSKARADKCKRELDEGASCQHVEARKRARDLSKHDRLTDRRIRVNGCRQWVLEQRHWVGEQPTCIPEQSDEAREQRDKLISAMALIELARGVM